VINFLIIAFVVFMLVRYVNKVKEAAAKKNRKQRQRKKNLKGRQN
jgi:large conductance mechanosensitive channel